MRRCFLQWHALALSYAVAGYFAFAAGLPQTIWRTDATHMTSVIAVMFVISCLYLGFASWRFREGAGVATAEADSGLGRVAAYVVTLIGLLGTAIGLMMQVKAMGAIDVSNPQNIVNFIATIGTALSTALYSTACGIIASVGITAMYANIDYFLDRRP